jgi:hypothetical protein
VGRIRSGAAEPAQPAGASLVGLAARLVALVVLLSGLGQQRAAGAAVRMDHSGRHRAGRGRATTVRCAQPDPSHGGTLLLDGRMLADADRTRLGNFRWAEEKWR